MSILIYGIKSEKKIFFAKFFFSYTPPYELKILNSYGGVHEKKIFLLKNFFPYFIPYIKMDKNSNLEYHIKKFLSYLSKPQYWFKIVTLTEGKVLLFWTNIVAYWDMIKTFWCEILKGNSCPFWYMEWKKENFVINFPTLPYPPLWKFTKMG